MNKAPVDSHGAAVGSAARSFEIGILLFHLSAALVCRTVAWPEVTTPAYLWSRGLLLYRDVKFVHTPGLIGLLALALRAFGPQAWVLRAFALAGPLASHAFVLSHTRRLSIVGRALISAFFLVSILASDGNAVWPTVLMSVLALPIATDLTRGRWMRAGLGIGAAILLKQTAAYVLLVASIGLLVKRNLRALPLLVLGASLPYGLALAFFSLFGAAREMVFWTLVVPFRVQEVTPPTGLLTVVMFLAAFLPTAAAACLEFRKPPDAAPSASWLLAVGFGFALLCYPNFMLLQTVAALPCLAVGAARFLEIASPRAASIGVLLLTAWTASRAMVFAAGADFDGKILFWNEDPAFNAVIAALKRYPPQAPLHSEVWANILPRSGRLPPGRLWVHPWLHWYFPVEHVRARVLRAAREPGTIWVDYRIAAPGVQRVGPFAIRVIGAGSEAGLPAEGASPGR